jgi:hypothetical protein
MKQIGIIILLAYSLQSQAQVWTVLQKADMIEPVANNAVVEGWANDTSYVYSFGGIDSTKLWSGIHLRSFRYNTISDVWDTIPSLPDTLGKIAAGASYVDSIIYIIGGYHVYANHNEASSAKVHRYDPRTNTYLSDGADIPIPIDDHVQAVYKDSLIYVVTGWSNTGNVPNVQIYDPGNDNWLIGTSTPNNNTYRAFGASGIIKGDTIYYHGGASNGFNFPGQSTIRKGYINPADPTQITWSMIPTTEVLYRAVPAYISWDQTIHWLGGSGVTYNYNGIAYNGSGGVNPKNTALGYFFGPTSSYSLNLPMDLRGIAKDLLGPYSYYTAGGMESGQKVTNQTWRIDYIVASIQEESLSSFKLFPNPTSESVKLLFKSTLIRTIQLIDLLGKEVKQLTTTDKRIELNVSEFPKGIYFVTVSSEKGISSQKIIIQ